MLPGGDALAPNAAAPNPPPKAPNFDAPNVGGDPKTGLAPKAGACPKAGCSKPICCDALAVAPPNTDGGEPGGEDIPGAVLFMVPPKKDVDPLFDAEPNIEF